MFWLWLVSISSDSASSTSAAEPFSSIQQYGNEGTSRTIAARSVGPRPEGPAAEDRDGPAERTRMPKKADTERRILFDLIAGPPCLTIADHNYSIMAAVPVLISVIVNQID